MTVQIQDNKIRFPMRNKIMGIDKRAHMLIDIFRQHNADIKALIGKGYASATLVRYETSLKHTVDFLQWKYKISDIDIRKINHVGVRRRWIDSFK